jgi:tetratricopeptide (TPR) repeat protein
MEILLKAEGRTVTKHQVFEAAWRGRAVTDDSLSQAVLRLRRAFPCGRGDQIVQRVHGAGLRLGVPCVPQTTMRSPVAGSGSPASASATSSLFSARELAARRNPTDAAAAVQAATRATEIDPDNVDSWCGLADIHAFRLGLELDVPAVAGKAAYTAAQRALDLDPDCARALAVRGWILSTVQGESLKGLRDLERSLRIEDSYWAARLLYGWTLVAAGRTQEAVAQIRLVDGLNPWGVWNAGMLSLYLMFDGRLHESLEEGRRAVELFPHFDTAHLRRSYIASVHGAHDEAIAAGRAAADLSPSLPLMHTGLAAALARAGRRDEALEVIQRIESSALPVPRAQLAPAWLALGARERALELLQAAASDQSPYLHYALADPRLMELRGDPAFERFRVSRLQL